jgi:hypothetical protein
MYDLKKADEIKEKIKNHDLFLADLDFTIAKPNFLKMIKSVYAFSKQDIGNLMKEDYKSEIVHSIYPGLNDFFSIIKSEKILITGNIPLFVKPIAKFLGINKIYYGNHIPDPLLSLFPNNKYEKIIDSIFSEKLYKKILFAGNSPNKDEGILERIKYKEARGEIESVVGIWMASNNKINKKFDINIFDDWSRLVQFYTAA